MPITWTDTSNLEREINDKFKDNPDYCLNDIAIFAEVTEYSYVPIETTIDKDGFLRVKDDPNLVGTHLYVGSTRQFLHKQIVIPNETIRIELDKDPFVTAWNESKFVVFRNGFLLSPDALHFVIPSYENTYLKKYMYSTVKFNKDDVIDIYYIESDENMDQVPISRDMYVGARKYKCKRRSERIILIPYPNEDYPRNEHSFFIFNSNGEYLDNRVDYIVSSDGVYITLSEEQALQHVNIDYIVFAFPELAADAGELDILTSTESTFDDLDTGAAIFKYSYSIDRESSDMTGIVRFAPLQDEYRMTKKNFLLFGNGVYISPDRYDIYENDSIVFNNEYDRINSVSKRYTMVIYDDKTDHDTIQIPADHIEVRLTATEDIQNVFNVPRIDGKYRTFLLFKGTLLVSSDRYEYDEEDRILTLLSNEDGETGLRKGRSLVMIWFNSNVNNSNMERSAYQYEFEVADKIQRGTTLPDELRYQTLTESNLLLFLNGMHLRFEEDFYLEDGRIHLADHIVMDDNGDYLDFTGHRFYAVYLETLYTANVPKYSKEDTYTTWRDSIADDKVGGQVFRIYESVTNRNPKYTTNGYAYFFPHFSKYQIAKNHIMLFGNGSWIHPDRYDIVDNGTIMFYYDFDKERAQYNNYTMLVIDDEGDDERYNPASLRVERVEATEDEQSVFEVPVVGNRYRSFIIIRHSRLLSKPERYEYDDVNGTITLLMEKDYLKTGESLYFIFMDAFTRSQQENQFIQMDFECDPSGVTKLPRALTEDNFKLDETIFFVGGRELDRSQYYIQDGYLYLDGFLLQQAEFDRYYFSVVYMITYLSSVRDYTFNMPTKPAYPVQPCDTLGNSYFSVIHSKEMIQNGSGMVRFENPFTGYELTKSNFLLFMDNKWVSPDRFELFDNDTLFMTGEYDKASAWQHKFTMLVFNDRSTRPENYMPTFFKSMKAELYQIDGMNTLDIPKMEDPSYASYILFADGNLVDIADDKMVIVDDDKITLLYDPYVSEFEFVFLNASTIMPHKNIFLIDRFTIVGRNGIIASSLYNETDFVKENMMLFRSSGELIPYEDYEIVNNELQLNDTYDALYPNTYIVVHLLNLIDDDIEITTASEEREPDINKEGYTIEYSYEISHEGDIVAFSPVFSSYELTKYNLLLFCDGRLIHPLKVDLLTNGLIETTDTGTHVMTVFNDATAEDKTEKAIKFSTKTIYPSEYGQTKIPSPDKSDETFLIFKNGKFIPTSSITVENATIEFSDPLLMNDVILYIVLKDGSTKDRRYPRFVEEDVYAYYDTNSGVSLSAFTDSEFDSRFIMVFENGELIPPTSYTIVDDAIFFGDWEQDEVHNITIVYLISAISSETIKKEEDEGHTKPTLKDPIPEDDDVSLYGIKYELYNSHNRPIEDKHGVGWVQFLNPFDGYDLTKGNFLLFGNSIFIDPERYTLEDNGTITFNLEEDKVPSEWTNYTMAVLVNRDALSIYGPNKVVRTDVIVKSIVSNTDNQTEFEMPTIPDNYSSYIVFRNGLLLPFNDKNRYSIDDESHRFSIINYEDTVKAGTKFTFVFLKASTNDGTEIGWVQSNFACDGYSTNLPTNLSIYADSGIDKKKVLLFLNGTYLDPSRYSIHDGNIYLEHGNYLGGDNFLYSFVYLTSNDSEEYELNPVDQIEGYEVDIDGVIFEDRYAIAKRVPGTVVEDDTEPGYNSLGFLRSIDVAKSASGLIRFNPVVSGYQPDIENIIFFRDGVFVPQDKYIVYDENNLVLVDQNFKADMNNHYYEDLTLVDTVDFTKFVAPKLVMKRVVAERSSQDKFDIPVIDGIENPTYLAFVGDDDGAVLLDGYQSSLVQLKLYPYTAKLNPGDVLYFLFLQDPTSREGKYTRFMQVSFPVSTTNITRIPDQCRDLDMSATLLFYEGKLLKSTEYTWNATTGKFVLIGRTANSGSQVSLVYLEEVDELDSSMLRR